MLERSRSSGRGDSIPRFFTDDPRTTNAWTLSTPGERRLATHLNRTLAGDAAVLHDRLVPGALDPIDHVVIGPTGIWVVVARSCSGTVECRDRDSWTGADDRLYVGGRNRTNLIVEATKQIAAVRRALDPAGHGGAPVNGVVCFTNAGWPPLSKTFQLDGVWVTDVKSMTRLVLSAQSFSDAAIDTAGTALRNQLPPA